MNKFMARDISYDYQGPTFDVVFIENGVTRYAPDDIFDTLVEAENCAATYSTENDADVAFARTWDVVKTQAGEN